MEERTAMDLGSEPMEVEACQEERFQRPRHPTDRLRRNEGRLWRAKWYYLFIGAVIYGSYGWSEGRESSTQGGDALHAHQDSCTRGNTGSSGRFGQRRPPGIHQNATEGTQCRTEVCQQIDEGSRADQQKRAEVPKLEARNPRRLTEGGEEACSS